MIYARTSWHVALRCSFLRPTWPKDPACHDRSFPRLKQQAAIFRSRHSQSFPWCFGVRFPSFWLRSAWDLCPTTKSLNEQGRRDPNLSKGRTCGRQSKKVTATAKENQGKAWRAEYHRKAAREVLSLSLTAEKAARIKDVEQTILNAPYANEKKHGQLGTYRAKQFTLAGVQYRAVYKVDEERNVIYFLCVAHAVQRLRNSKKTRSLATRLRQALGSSSP